MQIRGGYDLACCSEEPKHTLIFNYTLANRLYPCTPLLEASLKQDEFIYIQGQKPLEITLDQISNGDCRYTLSLSDATTGETLDPEMFKLTQPSFDYLTKGIDGKVSETKPASIQVQSSKLDQNGSYAIAVDVVDSSG